MGYFYPVLAATLPKSSCSEANKPPEGGGDGIKTLEGVNCHSSWLSVPLGGGPRCSPSGCGWPSRRSSPAPAAASRSPAAASRSPAGLHLPGPGGCQLRPPGHSPVPPRQQGSACLGTGHLVVAGKQQGRGWAALCREGGEECFRLGAAGDLTASPASHWPLHIHRPSRCQCLWVSSKEGGFGKHLPCFSELESVCFLKDAHLSTLEDKINPILQGCKLT